MTELEKIHKVDYRIKIQVEGYKTAKERDKLVSEFRRYLTGFEMDVDGGEAKCKIVSLRGLPD